MNINFIKFISFFIGLFITLVMLSYYKIIEPFTDVQSEIKDEKKDETKKENFDIITVDNQSVLPFEGYKFICINTYLDITKISLNDGKWFDNIMKMKKNAQESQKKSTLV